MVELTGDSGAWDPGAPAPADPSVPPANSWILPATPKRRLGRRRAVVVGLGVALLLAGAATGAVLLGSRSDHPGHWDARVAPIARFVERTRGLRFRHPVPVAFLADKAFRKEVTSDEHALTAKDRREIEQQVGFLRALGLVSGKLDLFKATNTLKGETILAFYDPDKKRVRIQGTTLDVATRVTLAHELTHALQDQHFDLNRSEDRLDADEQNLYRALVEGDATDVENKYVDRLSRTDQRDYDESQQNQADTSNLEDVPEVLQVLEGAPYELGPPLVSVLRADGGRAELDRAFKKPPRSEEQLLDPSRFVDGDQPKHVARPRLGKGEHKLDDGAFGAFGWYVTLSARIDPKEALRAVDGWGGDRYVAFKRDKTTCVRVAFRGDTTRDTEEMATALDHWVAAMPKGVASVQRGGRLVTLASCDPGASVKIDTGAVKTAVALPLGRVTLVDEFVKEGAPLDAATCVANKVVQVLTPEQFADDTGASIDEAALTKQIQGFIQQCI